MNIAEDCFHLGLKGLIRNNEGKILLLQVNKEKLDKTKESYWDIPGGRIKRGETAEDALRREIEEETGIRDITSIRPFSMTLSNIRIPQPRKQDVGLVLWVFTCNATIIDDVVLSDEHIELGWFTPQEVMEKLRFKYSSDFIEQLRALV
ncbi:MAG TPA: NUDIX domain-containing protein [Patescibacteria group bacterium]|jgi:8-oxo-dGTP pyrophosphatase MutT (NUDIX family)|nr:NUDIX domain-containing protein [Patescibacteria group bacterium]